MSDKFSEAAATIAYFAIINAALYAAIAFIAWDAAWVLNMGDMRGVTRFSVVIGFWFVNGAAWDKIR